MDRFTWRDKDGIAHFKPLDPDCGNCNNCNRAAQHLQMFADKLAIYEDAEAQDHLLMLPFKAGDTVYVAYTSKGLPYVSELKLNCLESVVLFMNRYQKDIFLTYDDALACAKLHV